MTPTALRFLVFGLTLSTLTAIGLRAESPSADDIVFFEKDVLPILKANCFACHGSEKKLQGGLKLTSREDILKGGESGPAVDLKKPGESLILQAINYDGLMMPPKGKLSKTQIDTLTKWVTRGLAWSEKAAAAAAKAHGPPIVDDEARSFWAFRPVVRPAVPEISNLKFQIRSTPSSSRNSQRMMLVPHRRRRKRRYCGGCFTH